MLSKYKKRGPLAVLGLSLLAALALGAISASAAQASPAWHIAGQQLPFQFGGETVEEESFQLKGAVEFESNWASFSCDSVRSESGAQSRVFGEDGGETALAFTECGSFAQNPSCTADSIYTGRLHVEPVEAGGAVYERFSADGGEERLWQEFGTLHVSGSECWAAGTWAMSGSVSALIDGEAVDLPLSFSSQAAEATEDWVHIGDEPAMGLSGQATQHLSGPWAGEEWGAW